LQAGGQRDRLVGRKPGPHAQRPGAHRRARHAAQARRLARHGGLLQYVLRQLVARQEM